MRLQVRFGIHTVKTCRADEGVHCSGSLACSCCDCIVQAAAPSRPIERGLPGPGLLAHIVASKFVYHLALYRQSVMYAHDGVRIAPGTMGHWLGALT
jgi:transposase